MFSMDRLEIIHGARKCAAVWNENTDPTWQGEPILGTFANDSIYPPTIIPDLFQRLWTEWRNGRFSAEEVQAELDQLTEYVNVSARAKPKSDFWRGTF